MRTPPARASSASRVKTTVSASSRSTTFRLSARITRTSRRLRRGQLDALVARRQDEEDLALRLPAGQAARASPSSWSRRDRSPRPRARPRRPAWRRARRAARCAASSTASSARSCAGAARRPRRRRSSAVPTSCPGGRGRSPSGATASCRRRAPRRGSACRRVPMRRPASWRMTAWWMSDSLIGAAKSVSASSTLPPSLPSAVRIVVCGIVTSPSARAAGRCAPRAPHP